MRNYQDNSGYRLAVACGGTGGHMFPGLATATELQKRGHEVTLWVAGRDVEQSGLAGWEGAVERLPSRGLTSRSPVVLVRALISWIGAMYRARKSLARQQPDALLAMGSYSSVGPALAAWSLGIPVVLHEANAVPGRAVGFLSHIATTVATTFEAAAQRLPKNKCEHTGLPLREMAVGAGAPSGKRPFTVLVMGGSLGAHRLNELAVEAFGLMWAGGDQDLRVIHLTGRADEDWVRDRYRDVGLDAVVHGFVSDMGKVYAEADVAVCRAGASSCMELCAMRVPAMLIPLPHAVRDHQTANAVAMADREAALWAAQEGLEPCDIRAFVVGCRRAPERMARMRASLAAMAVPHADKQLADLVESAAGVLD